MSSKNILETIVRAEILEGHEKIAPVERSDQRFWQEAAYGQGNSMVNANSDGGGAASYGPITLQHPDFIKFDGLPSPFNPEQNEDYDIVGDPVLYANEANKDKLAHKLGLSKDALEDKLKHELKLRNQLTAAPGISLPRPRPPG